MLFVYELEFITGFVYLQYHTEDNDWFIVRIVHRPMFYYGLLFLLTENFCTALIVAFNGIGNNIPKQHRHQYHHGGFHRNSHRKKRTYLNTNLGKMLLDKDDEPDLVSTRTNPIGLYVHIPYCRRRCRYCDFAIVPVGNIQNIDNPNDEYEDTISVSNLQKEGFYNIDQLYRTALLKEVQHIQQQQQQQAKESNMSKDGRILLQSIYFGGGTPSLAPIETIANVLKAAIGTDDKDEEDSHPRHQAAPFLLAPDAEMTIEMDPGTFTQSKLQSLRSLGFNRISLGVQSFDDTILEQIGRTHRCADIFHSIDIIHQVYGEHANYSIDLISGLPGLSLAKWIETLQIVTSSSSPLITKPSHISIYDLQVEQGTVFGTWYDKENDHGPTSPPSHRIVPPTLPSPDDCAFMYKYAAGYLRSKNYEHYEVSSYAYRGYDKSSFVDDDNASCGSCQSSNTPSSRRSRHNQVYWDTAGQWYAIGLGSTSYVGTTQVVRPKTLADYLQWVETSGVERHDIGKSIMTHNVPRRSNGDVGNDQMDYDKSTDIVMKRLRTSDGLDLQWMQDVYGSTVVQSILVGSKLGLELGLTELIVVQDDKIQGNQKILRLVDPDGFLYSNYIISNIFMELEKLLMNH